MPEFPIVKIETEEARVLSEDLITPDTPEKRKNSASAKFARGKYRVTLGLPKSSKTTDAFVKTFAAKAMEVLTAVFPDKTQDDLKAMIKARLRDGDAEIAAAKKLVGTPRERRVPDRWAGYYVLQATSSSRPIVIDANGTPLTAETCYPGMWVLAEIALVPYATGQGEGLTCWIDAVVKTRDDERFGRAADTSSLLAKARRLVGGDDPF